MWNLLQTYLIIMEFLTLSFQKNIAVEIIYIDQQLKYAIKLRFKNAKKFQKSLLGKISIIPKI